jgi:4-aminobutyrate aminotransferase
MASTIHPIVQDLLTRDAASVAGVEKLRFFPLVAESGNGTVLVEPGGRELLDFSSSWTAGGLGYGNSTVTKAIVEAATNPPGFGGISAIHPDLVKFAELLLSIVPGEENRRVYIGNTGSDANDVVLRACKFNTGKSRVITFENSYHGGVGFAMGVSGVHVGTNTTAADGAIFIPYPDPFRPHLGSIADSVADSLQRIQSELEAGDVACLIMEPIQSDGGLIVPPPGFMKSVATLCKTHDVLFICDEVKVGLGRTGLLHAFLLDDVVPDIVTFGKMLGGGLPLSAAVGPARILDGPTGSALMTAAGNPICVAAGIAALEVIVSQDLASLAKNSGQKLRELFSDLVTEFDIADVVGDVRGHGLAIGIDLVTDRETNNRNHDLARKTVYRAWELGVVVYYVGANVLEVTPPLTVLANEIEQGIRIIAQAIADAKSGLVTDEMITAYTGW